MDSVRVMMTGAGAPGAPGILKCYRNNGEREVFVLGVDARNRISTGVMLDAFEQIPLASSEDFVDSVVRLAKEYKIDVIQPLVTRELEVFAKNIRLFEENGIKVCVSSIEGLEIANNKRKLLEALQENGIEIPKYICISNEADFVEACSILDYKSNAICFKPSQSNGSRGFRVIDATVDRFDLLINQKPNSIYTSYEEVLGVIHNNSIPEMLVMEFLPGSEYSVDMLMDHGRTIYAIPRIRNTMNGGISTDCTVVEEKDVIAYSIRVAECLKLHGNIGVQIRRNKDGEPRILEINPRVQGSIVCCAAAGVNLPYYGIKTSLGEKVPQRQVKWGTQMIRYWDECYYDITGQSYSY